MKKLFSKYLAAGAAAGILALSASSAVADNHAIEKPWYATAGVGYLFLEKDEEVLGQQLYEVRAGKHINDRWSFEVGFGGMPDVRRRQFRDGKAPLGDDTWGMRFVADALYHLEKDAWGSSFDPYIGVGGGIAVYDDKLDDSHNDLFIAAGPGAFLNFDESWFAKADYRVAMVGDNTEVNHHVLLSLGYRWGETMRDNIAGAGALDDSGSALRRVYFPFDSSMLTESAKATLRSNAAYLEENPREAVTLEGHCDERGTNEYNLALGQRRAQAVYEYLVALGVSKERLKTVTYGEEVPLVNESNEAAWAKNRRVEFTLSANPQAI